MRNTIYIVGALIIGVILGGFIGAWLVGNQSDSILGASGGITRFPNGGLVARYFKVTTGTATSTAGTDGTLNIGAGTDISKFVCGSVTVDPDNVNASSSFNTTATVSGAALGNVVLVSSDSGTSTDLWSVSGNVSTTNIVAINMTGTGATNFNNTTTTFKACIIK